MHSSPGPRSAVHLLPPSYQDIADINGEAPRPGYRPSEHLGMVAHPARVYSYWLGGAGEVSYCGLPASVPVARQFVRDTLGGCPRADDLALAVTELASNAVTWSASGEDGTFTVAVRSAPRWARVEVTDPGPARQPTAHGNGWGLRIVAAITDRAGTTHGPGRTRTAWAEVTWPAEATP
jgi:hypothetical protein